MFEFLKKSRTEITAPVTGVCIPMDEVKDSVFSSKMLGDGFAVIPSGDMVSAPVTGEIVMIAESNHAFGMRTSSGLEVMVHIGIDTVELGGEGFTAMARTGKKVKAGTPVIKIDRDSLVKKGYDLTTMVIFTNGYDKEVQTEWYGKEVQAGQMMMS